MGMNVLRHLLFIKVMSFLKTLDEVIQTSQIIDYDGTTFPRSAFRNDRRFTFVARFEF